MASWKLPLVVAAITVPIVGGFLLAGPALGVAVGALAALALLVVAARQRPRGPIGAAPDDEGRRVLIVVTCAVEEPGAVAAVAAEVGGESSSAIPTAGVLVLAPANISFLDRWASDVADARREAQERLVATVAALAKAGIAAEARVGDEDVVQAVEDQLQSYPASEVILVSARGLEDEHMQAAAEELKARLRAGFVHLSLAVGGAREGRDQQT